MARIRNLAPEPRLILGQVVDTDEVFDVPDDLFASSAWPETIYEVVDSDDQDEE